MNSETLALEPNLFKLACHAMETSPDCKWQSCRSTAHGHSLIVQLASSIDVMICSRFVLLVPGIRQKFVQSYRTNSGQNLSFFTVIAGVKICDDTASFVGSFAD